MIHNVWFNHGMALLKDILKIVKTVEDGDLRIVLSHQQEDFAAASFSDQFAVEPAELSDNDYLEWCLSFARANHIDLFVPSRGVHLISSNIKRFEEMGTRVLTVAAPEVLAAIDHKGRLYERLAHTEVPIPEWRTASTLASLKLAVSELSSLDRRVCFKPARGVFGHGFRIIVENGTAYQRLLKSGPYTASSEIGMDEVEVVFGGMESFDDLLVMPYLDAPERSVDCLAHSGTLVASLIRLKDSHDSQVIEDNPQVASFVAELTAALELNGMFNVQFRNQNGQPKLLEINARPSGGMHKACMASGFPLPYWGLRLWLGEIGPEQIPTPKPGGRLIRKQTYEVIPAASQVE